MNAIVVRARRGWRAAALLLTALGMLLLSVPAALPATRGAQGQPPTDSTLPAGDQFPYMRLVPGVLLILGGVVVLFLVRSKSASDRHEDQASEPPPADQAGPAGEPPPTDPAEAADQPDQADR